MDWDSQTIETYDKSANELAEYFKGIGPRVRDIDLGLKLANVNGNAHVIEIGCGDGRDAKEIIKRVAWYEGFDPSKGMLKIAKATLPEISFVLADALTYNYPKQLDAIFAFASLLHVNKDDLTKVLKKCTKSLRLGGILYISLKEHNAYSKELVKDNYGERMFYYYNVNLITQIAGNSFTSIYTAHQKIGHTAWFTIVLKKS